MEQNVELAKPRDFGEIISDTFTFVKQNLKPLLKYFFIFCGFFMVATAVSTIMLQVKAMSFAEAYDPSSFDSASPFGRFVPLIWGYLALIVFVILQTVTFHVMVLCFMTIYKQKRNTVPTTEEMWGYIKFYFLRVLGSNIVLYILTGIAFVFCLIPGLYLLPIFVLVAPIMVMENATFGYAFGQSFKLIKDNWWMMFGVGVVLVIILYVLNLVINLPVSLLGAGNMFTHLLNHTAFHLSLPIMIVSAVLQSFTYFFQVLLVVAAGVAYYSLNESKEGTSLIERMDQFGQTEQDGAQPEEY